ncbi:MAG: 3-methyl-2-oxobutanoate hydroxymethyltransferase [Thermoanaerobaculia bacterium]
MSTAPSSPQRKVTLHTLQAKKERGEPITMLTAYDFPTARALDRAGVDSILVGDSLGMVVLGYDTTLPVTMEDMLHHARAVSRGARIAHLVGDMPFLSYQTSVSDAMRNAGRFLQEGGMNAVKLEGGREIVPAVRAIVAAGIPVVGHIGLTPQKVNQLGGFRTQGKSAAAARTLIEDAHALEDAGCHLLILEAIPDRLAGLITRRLSIPTIGIGAGAACGGQVLVTHDLLGLTDGFAPKFVKRYANLHEEMARAFAAYIEDVSSRRFPEAAHSHELDEDVFRAIAHEWDGALAH